MRFRNEIDADDALYSRKNLFQGVWCPEMFVKVEAPVWITIGMKFMESHEENADSAIT